jgi:prepilin-type N-terminal cleavage/methylation domain-containing protein
MPKLSRTSSASSRAAFTLIELLIVIAIIAIISTVLFVILNPAELLSESRDANRLSDLETIDKSIAVYETQTSGIPPGSSTVAYISIPDAVATTTAGDHCEGLGLPALPSPWVYHCANPNAYKNTDGTGWIPFNLNAIPSTQSIQVIPSDPKNQTSTGLYYTYTTDGTSYQLTAHLESQKYASQMASSNSLYPDLYTKKGNIVATLPPIDFYSASVATTSPNGLAFNTPKSYAALSNTSSSFTFNGTSGSIVSADVSFMSAWYYAYLYNPNGSLLWQSGHTNNTSYSTASTLPSTGTYTITVLPDNGYNGTSTISITSNATNPNISFNTPITSYISSTSSAEVAYNFSGTSGQVVNGDISYGGWYNGYLVSPTGTTLWSSGHTNGSGYFNGVTLGSTGTYTVLLVPDITYANSGNATVSITSNTTNPTISFNTPVTTYISSTSSAEAAYNFSATSGQVVSGDISYGGWYTGYLVSPTGTSLWSSGHTNGVSYFNGALLGSAGNYTVVLVPDNTYSNSGNATFSITSNTTNPTISFNTPVTNSISSTSTSEMAYNFSGTAGQIINANAGSNSWLNAYILSPTGTAIWSLANCNNGCYTNGKVLGSTGTYTFLAIPWNGSSGSATLSLTSNSTNPTISFATTASNTISSVSSAEFAYNFTGTAGQTVSLTTIFPNWYLGAFIINPDGSTLWTSGQCNGTCSVTSKTLVASGTHMIVFIPWNAVSGNVSTTLTTP